MTLCPGSTTPAWTYDNKKLEATSCALLSNIIFSCDSISLSGGEIAFRRDGTVRLLADASNFRLAFHNESRL